MAKKYEKRLKINSNSFDEVLGALSKDPLSDHPLELLKHEITTLPFSKWHKLKLLIERSHPYLKLGSKVKDIYWNIENADIEKKQEFFRTCKNTLLSELDATNYQG